MKKNQTIHMTTWIASVASILTILPLVRVGYHGLYTIAPVLFLSFLAEGLQKMAASKYGALYDALRKEKKYKQLTRALWLSFSYGLVVCGFFAVILVAAGSPLAKFVLYGCQSEAVKTLTIGFYLLAVQLVANHVLSWYQAIDLGSGKQNEYFISVCAQKVITVLLRILLLFTLSHAEGTGSLYLIHLASLMSTLIVILYYYLKFKEYPKPAAKVKGDKRLRSQMLRVQVSALRDLFISYGWMIVDVILFCFLSQKSGTEPMESYRLMGAMFLPCVVLAEIPFIISSSQSMSSIEQLKEQMEANHPKRFQKEFLILCREVLFYVVPFGFFVLFHHQAVWNGLFGYEDAELFGRMIRYAGVFGILLAMNYVLHELMRNMKLQPYYSAYEIFALLVKAAGLFFLLKYYHTSAFFLSWLLYEGVLLFLCITKVNLEAKMNFTKLFVDVGKIVTASLAMHGSVFALKYFAKIDGLQEDRLTSLWHIAVMIAMGVLVYWIASDVLVVHRKGSVQ